MIMMNYLIIMNYFKLMMMNYDY